MGQNRLNMVEHQGEDFNSLVNELKPVQYVANFKSKGGLLKKFLVVEPLNEP